jgi:hypothetical protein
MGILNHRQAFGDAPLGDAARQECLIVWGRVTKRGLVLEPAFVANTMPVLPSRSGKLRLAALDESGATLTSISFDPLTVEDVSEVEEHFAYAIPLSQIPVNRIASLTLTAPGRQPQTRTSLGANITSAQVNVTAVSSGMTRFRWNTHASPLLVITDAQTGQILSLATSGDAVVRTSAQSFKVKASNGVRSVEMQLRR